MLLIVIKAKLCFSSVNIHLIISLNNNHDTTILIITHCFVTEYIVSMFIIFILYYLLIDKH